ncbi:MAG: PQQ-binding-like beta-propeller repeat protein [Gammaproteobacteria bacterium]
MADTKAAISKSSDMSPDGAKLYETHCAVCHEGGVQKAPHKMFLEMMPTASIHSAMQNGLMQQQASRLSDKERLAIAEYLSGTTLAASLAVPEPRQCASKENKFDLGQGVVASGWGFDSRNTRSQPQQPGGLTAADLPDLELAWVFAYPGALRARSQPAVFGNTVFVGSQDGALYALDLGSGCMHWKIDVGAEIRTAIVAKEGPIPTLFFGDLLARAYAVNATSGEILWSTKADSHPNATITGTPSLVEDKLIVPVSSLEVTSAAAPDYPCCSFRGSLLALSIHDGSEVWRSYTIENAPKQHSKTAVGTPVLGPSGAPIWNSPTIDLKRRQIYSGTGENYSSPADHNSDAIIAVNIDTGERVWTYQATRGDAWNVACMLEDKSNCPIEDGPDYDFGSSAILVNAGDTQVLVAGQKSGTVHGINPDTGQSLWRTQIGRGGIQGGIHFGMAAASGKVYVPISDMDTGAEYTSAAEPGISAVNALDGSIMWTSPANNVCRGREFCEPGISAAVTAIPGAVIAGHMDGRLRTYAADTGHVLWEYDTARRFDDEAGTTAFGGSIGGAGPVVANGYLLSNSGYGVYFHMPGNVLLAFKTAK